MFKSQALLTYLAVFPLLWIGWSASALVYESTETGTIQFNNRIEINITVDNDWICRDRDNSGSCSIEILPTHHCTFDFVIPFADANRDFLFTAFLQDAPSKNDWDYQQCENFEEQWRSSLPKVGPVPYTLKRMDYVYYVCDDGRTGQVLCDSPF